EIEFNVRRPEIRIARQLESEVEGSMFVRHRLAVTDLSAAGVDRFVTYDLVANRGDGIDIAAAALPGPPQPTFHPDFLAWLVDAAVVEDEPAHGIELGRTPVR